MTIIQFPPPLRTATTGALRLTAATRLLGIRDDGLLDATPVTDLAHCATVSTAGPRAVVADPCRLPFVAALFDTALVRVADAAVLPAELREVWRVLAPAGIVVVVARDLLGGLLDRDVAGFTARRLTRVLAAAMFEAGEVHAAAHYLVVRAHKTDGLAPLGPGRAAPAPVPSRA